MIAAHCYRTSALVFCKSFLSYFVLASHIVLAYTDLVSARMPSVPFASKTTTAKPKTRLTIEQVEQLKQSLSALPELPPKQRSVTTKEAVELLKEQIRELRAKGYSFEQIAEHLRNGGLAVGHSTLRNYAKEPRRSKRRKAARPANPVTASKNSSKESSASHGERKGHFTPAPDLAEI